MRELKKERARLRRRNRILTLALALIIMLLLLLVYFSENPIQQNRPQDGTADYAMGEVVIDLKNLAGFAFKKNQLEFSGSTRMVPGEGGHESFQDCAKTMELLVRNDAGRVLTVTQKVGPFLDVDAATGEKTLTENPGLTYYFYVYDITDGQTDPAAGDERAYLAGRTSEELPAGGVKGYADSGLEILLEPGHTYCFKWILWVDYDTLFQPAAPEEYGVSVEGQAREKRT